MFRSEELLIFVFTISVFLFLTYLLPLTVVHQNLQFKIPEVQTTLLPFCMALKSTMLEKQFN